MKKRITHSISLLATILLVVLACKKIEQPEMTQLNQECECAKEVSADFVMEEMNTWPNGPNNKLTETDTVFKNKNVQFRAFEDNADYTWYIGQEILNGQITGRFFDENLAGNNIPITLVVKKKPNKICFPNDNGYDSITKIMHVSHFISETTTDYDYGNIEGRFRVKSPHLPDSFDIEFEIYKNELGQRCSRITNYNGLGDDLSNCLNIRVSNYRYVFFDGYFEGFLHNRLDDTFEAKFDVYNPIGSFHYFGRRL